jgi:predicted TIM-barrel fold metal-dependent hydrolase
MDEMGMNHIDVHAHFLPESYREAALAAGHSMPDGFHELPSWSATQHIAMMDRVGIAVSMLSISSPGVHFGDVDSACSLAREVNDDGHFARISHPGRFGLLASLPLPDVEGSIEEIEYCYDEIEVDGVCLLTNVGGVYLGDPVLEPIFEALDRRGARIFIHPTSPICWEHTSLGRPRPMIEFLFDTTRAVVNMILNGTIARHPNIEIIVPHLGATLPMIADRVSGFSTVLPDIDPSANVLTDLARLHYDLAGFAMPRALDVLQTMTSPDHLHYGSDYPFTSEFVVELLAAPLRERGDPSGSFLDGLADNTRRLFPTLAGSAVG